MGWRGWVFKETYLRWIDKRKSSGGGKANAVGREWWWWDCWEDTVVKLR